MKKGILKFAAVSLAFGFAPLAFAQTNADYMFSGTKHPSYDSSYASIDSYVKGLSIPVSMSYEDAAKKICAQSKTEIQKARAIFTWVATNIKYDVYFREATCYDADGTWKERCGVCQGYALLYNKLATAAGLNAEYVRGFSKSSSYQYGDDFGSHGWSIVHLANRDLILDPCWAAGSTDLSKKTFTFDFKDCWFDVDPNLMIATHFPRESKFQLMKTPVTQNKFASLPYINPTIDDGGMDGSEVFDFYVNHNKAWFPLAYGVLDKYLKKGVVINKMPLAGTLKSGESYTVNISFPSELKFFFNVDGKQVQVSSGKDVKIKPKSDIDVILYGSGLEGNSSSYQGIFKYAVSDDPSFEYETVAALANSQILAGKSTAIAQADTGIVTTATTPSGETRVATVVDASDPGNSTEVTNVPDDYVTPLRVPVRINVPIETTKGFKNAKGLIHDPFAKISFAKDGKIIGDFKVQFNKAGNQINFVDKNNKKKIYGTFLYKEQYWKKYDKKLNSIKLNMDEFYEKINLVQTDLWRDAKGKCVGPTCEEPAPTVTEAQVQAETRKPNKQGLNLDNLSKVTFDCTDGKKRDNQANGRGKVFLFYLPRCGNCHYTAQWIKREGGNIGDVDFIVAAGTLATKEQAESFKSQSCADSTPCGYDEDKNTTSKLVWNYLRKSGYTGNSVTFCVMVYIDANNKIQYIENGAFEAKHIKEIVADYL